MTKLFAELGPRYASRPGGYLRILKFGRRALRCTLRLDRKRSQFLFGTRQLIAQRLSFALQNRKLLFQLRKRAFQMGFLALKLTQMVRVTH